MTIIAVYIALVILGVLSAFQLLLILGKPLGEYAWGGQHKILPRGLKFGSAVAIVLYFIFTLFLISKAEVVPVITNPGVLDTGMWIITGYFFLGVAVNAISRSKKERKVMVPVSLLLALSFLTVALV